MANTVDSIIAKLDCTPAYRPENADALPKLARQVVEAHLESWARTFAPEVKSASVRTNVSELGFTVQEGKYDFTWHFEFRHNDNILACLIQELVVKLESKQAEATKARLEGRRRLQDFFGDLSKTQHALSELAVHPIDPLAASWKVHLANLQGAGLMPCIRVTAVKHDASVRVTVRNLGPCAALGISVQEREQEIGVVNEFDAMPGESSYGDVRGPWGDDQIRLRVDYQTPTFDYVQDLWQIDVHSMADRGEPLPAVLIARGLGYAPGLRYLREPGR